MAVSNFTSSSNVNDFNINITSAYSTATLDREYPSGYYNIVSSVNDTTIDVYAFNSLGTLVGYTGTKAFTATAGFSKLVVLGGTTGDVLGFSYKTTFTTASETAETGAGPVLLGASPTSLPNVNNSLTLTGYNFASGMSVVFTGSDSVVRGAKSVVVGSATSAIVTRPDTFPVSAAPYTVSATNPGVNTPVGSNANTLPVTVTAGATPSWVTASGTLSSQAYYTVPYSYTLSATDADGGSSITYALTAGALPPGLSLNTSTGAITGTPTNNATNTYSFSVTVTDSGNNTATQSFSIINNISVTMSYLVVGGGGGGGYDAAGGGGAGGLVVGTLAFSSGTISVGNGGGGGSGGTTGGTGGGSVLTGTSVTVTAYGGGGGGSGGSNGQNGGSSGGSGYTSGLTGGSVYQPSPSGGTGYAFAGGNAPATVQYSGAGGGGAGGAGANNNAGGTGGAGYASSITGTSLYYAGGGGAGGSNNANGGSGVGGHGAAPSQNAAGSPGATNTGSGGGGGGFSGVGGNGATGIVIISYPNTNPALGTIPGTLTYTVNTNVSGNRVYQFTSGSGVVGF